MKDKLLKNKKGFTLIELIVVIAIIGVLVLLATPKFINYLAEAKEARYAYNVKVVEQQMEIYQVRGEAIPNIENWSPIEKETLEQMLREGKVYSVDGNLLKVNLDDKLGAFIFTTPVYADELVSKLPDDIYKIIPRDSELLKDVNDKETYVIGETTNKVYYVSTKLEGLESEVEEPIVEANDPSDFIYRSVSGGIEITDYKGDSKDVVIPETVDGQPVKSIGYKAFIGKQLTSVVIPDGVEFIRGSAFHNNQLTSITIPSSVKNISTAFSGNPLLEAVVVETDNQNYKSINNAIYTKDGKSLILGTKVMANNIENTVNRIEYGAFEGMGLTSVTIPNGVTYVGDYSFNNNQLTSVVIPDSLTSIGKQAFSFNQLKTINLNNVNKIMSEAFFNNNLVSVTIGDAVYLYFDAISNSFETTYNSNGQTAGTYTSDGQKGTWIKQ